jgi:hypothetical protein
VRTSTGSAICMSKENLDDFLSGATIINFAVGGVVRQF